MQPDLATRLSELPRLDRVNAWAHNPTCKICDQRSPFFDVTDLNKCVGGYAFGAAGVCVPWHRCSACGYLFTRFFDDWTNDDFSRWIYNDDYAKVDPEYQTIRPLRVASRMATVLADYKDARILDYGGGSGVFAGRLSELGFGHVEAYDPLSLPVRPTGKFDIVTCIEVIEHALQPHEIFGDIQSFLQQDACVIIGESLQPPNIDQVKCHWWYVAPRNGHVSMYADSSLVALAERFGFAFHRGPETHHVFHQGKRFRGFAESFGPTLSTFRLGAPGIPNVSNFYGVEGLEHRRFQWTREQIISWRISVPIGSPRTVQIIVPWAHESRQRFAAECVLKLANRPAQPALRELGLFAEFANVPGGEVEVILSTPSLTAAKQRDIGVALVVV